ncbi:ATP-binding protein [Alkaliphilus serpentinus]|uniref:histidine kinase n=1 Tax=Alkaliphilus serpentinus TaxID=1482731 RepID=A0A833HQ17_9FIRM|nr:ATP-binding protein [Alkaliphilus serpentinus]KAB3531453.1 ATP-binding protein [Alkaliphilus serpentinus]
MKELALHILDVAENSIRAKASIIKLTIIEDIQQDLMEIIIEDNGIGMEKELLDKVLDPFVTSRTTRRVGLGLSLFKAAAQQCEGDLAITSQKNIGTKVKVYFQHSHIDRVPLGNIVDTIITLILSGEEIDVEYMHIYNQKKLFFSTSEIKKSIEGVPITDVQIIGWIKEYLEESVKMLVK